MNRVKPKVPKPSAKAPPSQKIKVPPPKTKKAIPPVSKEKKPVLSTAYNCLNNTGDLIYYLLEVGAKNSKPFTFLLPPRAVSWRKPVNIQEIKTQGNIFQPLYFSLAENKKLTLSGIIFDQNSDGLPHERLQLLQSLQLPVNTKLRVYQLLVGNTESKQFAARSYGKFVISSVDIAEQLRDSQTGKTLRAIVNIELTEVSSQQLDFGKDLSVPSTIVPTLPPELTGTGTNNANSGGGEPTPDSGNVIKAGTVVGFVGYRGVAAGINSSHLHMTYSAPGKTLDQTMEPLYSTGQLPIFVQQAVSLGPFQKVPKKKLSELKTYSGIKRKRKLPNRPPADHRGADYQPTPLANKAMFKCPINIEVDMYFVRYDALPFSTLTLECFVKGYEGKYTFLHLEGLASDIDTSRKRVSSSSPNNPGGKTPTAQKLSPTSDEKY
jgi:hypothetical protein